MSIRQALIQFLTLLLWGLLLTSWGGTDAAFGASLSGVYALSDPNTLIPPTVLNNPNVDGLALRYSWDQLEPREGVFKWSQIDAQIAAAQTHGKKVSLGITAGIHTPAWVYATGASYFTFVWDKSWGLPICSKQRIPIPWDPLYLAKWREFVQRLGAKYAKNPAVVYVKITGINAATQETILPHSRNVAISRAGVSCVSDDDVAAWQAVGYSRTKVEQAWNNIANSFAESFPEARLGLMAVPGGFPPVDETGNLIVGKKRDKPIVRNLIAAGLRSYGGRFVVQNNGLSATWSWKELASLSGRATVGWQMLWSATKDPGCRMNGHVDPCDAHAVLLAAVNRGMTSEPSFMEIYLSDILNPRLSDIIATAHSRLALRRPR